MTLTTYQLQFNQIAASHDLPEVFSKDDVITQFWIDQGYSSLSKFMNLDYFRVICEMVKYRMKRKKLNFK